MQRSWLKKEGKGECILFFAGWGMDATPFAEVPAGESDLCMVCDYRQLAPVDLEPLAGYGRLHLVAWSMGVWVASHLLAEQRHRFSSLTAIGGTLKPIDPKEGIPPENYQAMLANFGPDILQGFYENMFEELPQCERFLANRPQRTLDQLAREMAAFQEAYEQFGPGTDIYTRKIITSRDRIFSGRNQIRAWGKGHGVVRNWPHFPFYGLEGWQDILAG